MNVGVVGATGMVGRLMLSILAERNFPIEQLRLFASPRSAGRTIEWNGRQIVIEDAGTADFAGLDVALFSAGASTSKELAPRVAASGVVVIDNSSAWRMDDGVPLVVPEVNADALASIPNGIIANPNCTTMVVMPVIKPLHEEFGLQSMVASTYQAVSGAGVAGVGELSEQIQKAGSEVERLATDSSPAELPSGKFAGPIAFNVLSVAGNLVDDETDEEKKFRNESRKILGIPQLDVVCTCVRVPVVTGHSVSVTATFDRPVSVARVQELMQNAPGVQLDDMPTPLTATGGDVSLVGRFRVQPETPSRLTLFISGDNLRKGAALNTVQIAEALLALKS